MDIVDIVYRLPLIVACHIHSSIVTEDGLMNVFLVARSRLLINSPSRIWREFVKALEGNWLNNRGHLQV